MNTDDGLFLEPIFSSNINIRKNKFVNSAMGTFFVRNSYWDLGDGESIFDIFDNDVELPSSYQWAGLDMRFLDESSSTKIRNNRFSSLGGAVSDHGYILTLFSKNMRMLNNSFASPTLPSPYGVVLAGSENVELLSNSFGEGMERDVSLGYLGIPEYDSHNCKVVGSKEATTTVLYYTDDNVLINVNGERGNLAPAGDYDSAVLDAGPRSEYTNFRLAALRQ
jgi:hypothetical protein